MRRFVLALVTLALAAPAFAESARGLPRSRLSGGGPAADDCLGSLEVVGVELPARARTVVCTDGDHTCDRDRLVNGSCELWLRVCLNESEPRCNARGVASVTVGDAAADRDRTILARTLASVTMPSAEDSCGALTTLTVPLGTRRNGSKRKGRKLLALTAVGSAGEEDADSIKFLCKPPSRVRHRDAISFPTIRKRVFEKSCAFSGCHGLVNPQADLILVGDGAYDNLVDVPASTLSAAFAGKKRVVPGAPTTSFLMDKLVGALAPGDGAPMPLDRSALPEAQIEAIRQWILAGAPRERVIPGGLHADLARQPRIPSPAPPAGGFQAHVKPFFLGDRPEAEGCQFARLGNPEDIFVRQWELFMHEGSHHFIVRAFRCRDDDRDGVNDCDEPDFDARFPSDFRPCEEFNHLTADFLVGSQTSHFIVDYQTPATGVGLRLHRNQPLLLNSHYTNPYSDTLAEVWVNVTPVDPALVTHPARILFEIVANAFIRVPPGKTALATSETCAFTPSSLCQLAGEPAPVTQHFALLGVTSHMHKRSLKFVTDLHDLGGARISRGDEDMTDPADGSKHLYVSTEYSDPVNLDFWPPIIVRQGQRLEYTCFHDNGVDTPVKLGCEETPGVPPGRSAAEQALDGKSIYRGAARWCHSDADCAGFGTGRCVPALLVFGELADDDMCILPGLYYECPGDAASCT